MKADIQKLPFITNYPAMNTLSATELRRHGMAAVQEALKKEPVHILQNNRP